MKSGRNCDRGGEFRGVGARAWILERRNGLARGIRNRSAGDGRFPGRQLFAGAQWCLYALIPGGGYSAYPLVFGPNPADLSGWGNKGKDLIFARGASRPGQFVQQWELRMMAREAKLKEVAESKLLGLLAYTARSVIQDSFIKAGIRRSRDVGVAQRRFLILMRRERL